MPPTSFLHASEFTPQLSEPVTSRRGWHSRGCSNNCQSPMSSAVSELGLALTRSVEWPRTARR
ncbi:hypothetical protein TIFTF001_046554 [Ficus carica]|uniref:Uncharacterized protein n=1 Tax=Ficus carica TaxID=3494 RepID=A0AA88CRD9_FICCA|nr:hypothetical protein TIFTF001_046554 [Ficus carica]